VFGTEGIFLEIPLDLSRLIEVTKRYLTRCCELTGTRVLNLPNRGSNGDVYPRVAVLDEFGEIEEEVSRLFNPPGISSCQVPISVRVKGGGVSTRFSSDYVHSDTWSGHPACGGVVMLPIYGDFGGGGVEFYRPTKNLEVLMKNYPSYAEVPDFGPELVGKMKAGHMYVIDHSCLHRTLMGKERVSVDFRFQYEEKLPLEYLGAPKRVANYRPYSEWRDHRYQTQETL
jgi:hypothetical protein